MTVADQWVYWVLLYVSIPANLYPLFYAYRPWRSTPQGRALMVMALGTMMLLNIIVAFSLFGEYPGRPILRALAFTVFAVGTTYLFVTLLHAPNAKRYPPFTWFRWVLRRKDPIDG